MMLLLDQDHYENLEWDKGKKREISTFIQIDCDRTFCMDLKCGNEKIPDSDIKTGPLRGEVVCIHKTGDVVCMVFMYEQGWSHYHITEDVIWE